MSAPLDLFRALADPTRLRIITLLRSMELSVGELAQVLGQSQPRVSRHVKILVDAGLVDRRKEGAWVFIALSRGDAVAALLPALDVWNDKAGGDHWAIAVPLNRSHPVISRSLVDKNDYPREALLEAVLRFIEEDLSAGGGEDPT